MEISSDNPLFSQAKAYEDLKISLNGQITDLNKQLADVKAQIPPNWKVIADKIFVIGLAFAEINIPYKFGAEYINDKAFDCSSFVQTVYRCVGIKLPRVSSQQFASGVAVDLKDVRKGDLLFFDYITSDGKPTSHVAIADGEGHMLHTNKAGLPIRIVDFSTSGFVGARRVIPD